ncbi:MAG TPA: SIS domain-containing protein [Ktedonobacterales bacterium]|jgi:glutamine---fructose-6-phosphate transaminase (isomerizing)|nr:SIS domain-containing protein [Ktedonobacterales bacterium]
MDTILESEIRSQPTIVERLLERNAEHIAEIVAALPSFDYVMIAARGSSDHAALYAKYLFGALCHVPVALAAPSLYTLYRSEIRLGGALVIGVSQSGQSPDIIAVLEAARAQHRPTIAITNDGASPLAQAADHVIELHADLEQSVAATKTYTAELAIIAALAAAWSGNPQRLTELRHLPTALEETLTLGANFAGASALYRDADAITVIGRGYNYCTAFEVALKLKELTYIIATAYSSADFRHGPIATVGAGSPVLLVAPSGHTFADMMDLAAVLSNRGADLLMISDAPEALALARSPFPLPAGTPEWLSPIIATLPGQQLALRLAQAKGINPDAPRGLTKVTRTQ